MHFFLIFFLITGEMKEGKRFGKVFYVASLVIDTVSSSFYLILTAAFAKLRIITHREMKHFV